MRKRWKRGGIRCKGGRMVETHDMGWQRNGKEGGKGNTMHLHIAIVFGKKN